MVLVNGEVQRRHPPILPPKLTTNQNARFLPLADRHLLPSAQGQLAQCLQIILLITSIPLSTHGPTTLRDRLLALTPCPFHPNHQLRNQIVQARDQAKNSQTNEIGTIRPFSSPEAHKVFEIDKTRCSLVYMDSQVHVDPSKA